MTSIQRPLFLGWGENALVFWTHRADTVLECLAPVQFRLSWLEKAPVGREGEAVEGTQEFQPLLPVLPSLLLFANMDGERGRKEDWSARARVCVQKSYRPSINTVNWLTSGCIQLSLVYRSLTS